MATEVRDWKDHARELRAAGLSERQIAEEVGKAPSSVHEALAGSEPPVEPESNGNGAVTPVTTGQQDIYGGETVVPPEEIVVTGDTQLGFFDAGGKKPQTASIRFVGGKVAVEHGTAFKKGNIVHFSGYATVVEVAPRDKRDRQTRMVVDCEQKHLAEIDDLTVASDERELLLLAFRRYVGADRQAACVLADEMAELANGGG